MIDCGAILKMDILGGVNTHHGAKIHIAPGWTLIPRIAKHTHHAYRNTKVTLDLGGHCQKHETQTNIADADVFCVLYFFFNMFSSRITKVTLASAGAGRIYIYIYIYRSIYVYTHRYVYVYIYIYISIYIYVYLYLYLYLCLYLYLHMNIYYKFLHM